jgi:hypothetical protein
MYIQDIHTKRKMHVPDVVGRGFIQCGIAVACERPHRPAPPTVKWIIKEGQVEGSVLHPPYVFAIAGETRATFQGENSARAAKHGGEEIPNYVLQEYLAALAKYRKWAKSQS